MHITQRIARRRRGARAHSGGIGEAVLVATTDRVGPPIRTLLALTCNGAGMSAPEARRAATDPPIRAPSPAVWSRLAQWPASSQPLVRSTTRSTDIWPAQRWRHLAAEAAGDCGCRGPRRRRRATRRTTWAFGSSADRWPPRRPATKGPGRGPSEVPATDPGLRLPASDAVSAVPCRGVGDTQALAPTAAAWASAGADSGS